MMMTRLEVLVDEVEVPMLGGSKGAGERPADAGYIQLPRSGLR